MKQALQLLSMAHRARCLVFGDRLLEFCRQGKVFLVIVAGDIGPASARKIKARCLNWQVPIMTLATSAQLAQALGKGCISNVGFTDRRLAQQMMKIMEVSNGTE